MARIALIVGMVALGAITGGLGDLAAIGIAGGMGGAFAGAALGASVGSVLGSLIFPPSFKAYPPLNDLQVMSSAPGNPIPWGYGSYRIAGNVIWANQIKEKTTKQSAGGGKGGGPTTNVYTYTVDIAISFGYGPGTVTRIWADAKLIYDVTNKGPIAIDTGLTDGNQNQITTPFEPMIYNGTATQGADPTIQAAVGATICPAFRDQIYMVLTAFPLADFGNRVPSFRAEVTQSEQLDFVTDFYGPNILKAQQDVQLNPNNYAVVDQVRRFAYIINSTNSTVMKIDTSVTQGSPAIPWAPNTVYPPGSQVLDSNNNIQVSVSTALDQKSGSVAPTWATGFGVTTVDHHVTWAEAGPGPDVIPIVATGILTPKDYTTGLGPSAGRTANCVDGNGFLWGGWANPSGNWVLIKYDPNTFKEISRIGPPLPDPSGDNFFNPESLLAVTSSATGRKYLFVQNGEPDLYIIDVASNAVKTKLALFNNPVLNVGGHQLTLSSGNDFQIPAVDPQTGIAYVLAFDSHTPFTTYIVRCDMLGTGVATKIAVNYTPANSADVFCSCLWDTSDGTLVMGNALTGDLIKVDPATGNIIWTVTGVSQADTNGSYQLSKTFAGIVPSTSNLYILNSNGSANTQQISKVNTASGELIANTPTSSWLTGTASFGAVTDIVYDAMTNSMFVVGGNNMSNLTVRIFLERLLVAETPMPDVLNDIWTKAGGELSDLDTSLVSSMSVKGYAITQNGTGKGLLVPLCAAYFFDLVESDNKLVAVPRGQSVSTVIPEADLGLIADQLKAKPTIAQEQDLPKTMTLVYYDPTQNYQQAKQQYQRNARVKRTKNQSVVSLPLTLDPDTAAGIVYKMLSTAWAERNTWEINLWRASYLVIDPTDVIQFTYNGTPFQVRVIKHEVGANMVLKLTTCSEDPAQYIPSAVGIGIDGFRNGGITFLPLSAAFLLDIPFISDTDNDADGIVSFYLAMGGVTPSAVWPGGVLYNSVDNQNWNPLQFTNVPATYGTVIDATPAPAELFTWDYETEITVFLIEGTLTGTTKLNVLNGANWASMGGETFGFVNSVQNPDGSFTLSVLARGLRGTEEFCGTHVAGETFVLMSTGDYKIVTQPTSSIGIAQFFRGITVGGSVLGGQTQELQLAGNALKPYAVAQLNGTVDGSSNINMTWERRTRIGGEIDWADGPFGVPLSEDSESYDLTIFDGSGNVKRTVTGLTTNSYQYTAANQVTDFGSHQASVHVTVWQNSATVGHGFPTNNPAVGTGTAVTD